MEQKRKIRDFFLFGRRAAEGHSRALFWLWNWALLLLAGVGLTALSLILAIGDYPVEIFWDYFAHPLIFLMNLLPVLWLLALLYLAVNRGWIAFLLTSVVVMAASIGNYFKLIFRDDPFLFADMSSVTMALKVADGAGYEVTVDRRIAFCLICVVLAAVVLFFFQRGRLRGRGRVVGLVLAAAVVYPGVLLYGDDNTYNNRTQSFEHINRWSSTQLYISKGFVYPFLHSIKTASPARPAGYSDQAARDILAEYTPADIPAEKKVTILAIQLEAFNDLTAIGFTDIDPSVYEDFYTLRDEGYSGRLVTNIFAGGTVDTERCYVTGDTALIEFRRDAGSYARYFTDQGYAVSGSHTCYDWFYNRKNVNAYLGFPEYWFYENRYAELSGGAIGFDDVLLPDLVTLFHERGDAPWFNLTVTYQGHGPYTTDAMDWGEELWTGAYQDPSTYYILNNYLGSVKSTGQELLRLARALEEEPEPVVLVVFGDHNPWLGNSNSVYTELGIDLDASTETGFYNYYSTPYVIWGNPAAKEALGTDLTGVGPDVSPCFLMNVIFDVCGLGDGPAYLQLMDELYAGGVTVVNTNGMFVENGVVTGTLSPENRARYERVKFAEYYRWTHAEA